MEREVLFERHGRVGLLTINRPAQHNAVSPEVTRGMHEALAELEADSRLEVGVVTGAGDRSFCAGADLRALADGRIDEVTDARLGGFAGIVRAEREKPLVAAVNGAAFAGGFEIVLACDLAVAAEEAVFGLPEVQRGVFAGAGGVQRLPRRLPPALAMEVLLAGRLLDAVEAQRLGLVNAVVPRAEVLDRALELAEVVATASPLAVRATLEVARVSLAESEQAAWDRAAELWPQVQEGADLREGALSFTERRRPRWSPAPRLRPRPRSRQGA